MGGSPKTPRNIENLIGGTGDDSLTGDNLANVVKGGLVIDSLDGSGGIDTADISDKVSGSKLP